MLTHLKQQQSTKSSRNRGKEEHGDTVAHRIVPGLTFKAWDRILISIFIFIKGVNYFLEFFMLEDNE